MARSDGAVIAQHRGSGVFRAWAAQVLEAAQGARNSTANPRRESGLAGGRNVGGCPKLEMRLDSELSYAVSGKRKADNPTTLSAEFERPYASRLGL